MAEFDINQIPEEHKHTQHINPGTDTTINPVVIDDSKRSNPNKGELVYGSITKSGEDWRMRSFDAGMGETEYRIFKNEKFFAQFDNRKDADTVMELMTGATEAHPPEAISKELALELCMDARKEAQQRIEAAINELEEWVENNTEIYGPEKDIRIVDADRLKKKIALLQAGRK